VDIQDRKRRKRKRLLLILLCLLLAGAMLPAGILIRGRAEDAADTRDTAALREAAGLPAGHIPGDAAPLRAGAENTPAPPRVDFTALADTNGEIGAWLVLDGTGIDYPVVQAADNEYYLSHTAERKRNKNGALFLDYRAHPDFSDFNNVVYGHNMKSGKMFGTLEKFKEKAYFDGHTAGILYTPGQTYRLEIFAVAVTGADSPCYGYAFVSPAEREAHLGYIRDAAKYWRDTGVTEKDRLLVLSTCSYEYKDARTLLFAKLAG
jgi:sortase B